MNSIQQQRIDRLINQGQTKLTLKTCKARLPHKKTSVSPIVTCLDFYHYTLFKSTFRIKDTKE